MTLAISKKHWSSIGLEIRPQSASTAFRPSGIVQTTVFCWMIWSILAFKLLFINLYVDFYILFHFRIIDLDRRLARCLAQQVFTAPSPLVSTVLHLLIWNQFYSNLSHTNLLFSLSPYLPTFPPPPSAAMEWFRHSHPYNKNLQIGKNLENFMVKTTPWRWSIRSTFFHICPTYLFPILLSFYISIFPRSFPLS